MSKGPDNNAWKGGRTVTTFGYIYLYAPEHPYKNKDNQVAEHRLIIEEAIGRYLKPSECGHHVNEDVGDNRNANLVACEDWAYHNLLHQRMRAYRAYGNAKARSCRWCSVYDEPDNLFISKDGRVTYHRKCNAIKTLEYKAKRENNYGS